MNVENFEFLKKGLLFMGFGEKLNENLEAKIKEQPKEFQLVMQGEFKKEGTVEKVDYKLDFRKSETTDMFFFNRYRATLKNDDPSQEKSQMFYINKNSGITAKEAFNLLSGRSVNKDLTTKEGQPYNAWLKLDFSKKDKNENFEVKQFTSGYGYDLNSTLKKYPIKELESSESLVRLIGALERGNLQPVTFIKEGKEERMHVEANPQFKTLNLYDADMKKIFQVSEKKESQGSEKTNDKKEIQKQEVDDDDGPGKKSSRKKGIGV